MKRVLFVSSCVRGGGAGWSLHYLLKHLDRSRVEPHVLVPAQGIFEQSFREMGVRVWELPALTERSDQMRFRHRNVLTVGASHAINLVSTASTVPAIARLVRSEGIDVVYCNNMLVKPTGALAAQRAGVPCVLHVRNIHERWVKRTLYGNVARLSAVRRVIANSRASAAPYERYVPEKVVVVHNGVDVGEYRPGVVPSGQFRTELGLDTSTVLVGFTGHLIPRKGLEPLVRAAARVLETVPNTVFAIVGRVPVGSPTDFEARYRALAAELGVADRVIFAGFRADVRPAVTDFDVLVLPSFQEPFGRSIIEAMALGTAVVSTRVGGVPEIITSGEDGLLVDPGDVDALVGAIRSLVVDVDTRQRIGAAARRRVEHDFDVAKLNRRVVELVLDVAGAGEASHDDR